MSSVCILLGYFTLTRSFALYDTAYRDRFFEGERSRLTFVRKAEFIFCTPKFWIELLVTYALVAIMPFRFGFLSLINVLSFYKTIQYSQAKLYIALIVFPLFFLINFLAYYSAFNWWILRYRKKKSEEKIMSMMKDDVTVLFVSHSSSQVRKICNKAIILEQGRLMAQGTADEMCAIYDRMIAGETFAQVMANPPSQEKKA
jgi:ABC-type multidrug transport system fused ATPase/permease subunit